MSKPARFDSVPTVSEVVRRAVEAVDPQGADPDLADFEQAFEDDDVPVSAVTDFAERLGAAAGGEALADSPAVAMAVAASLYLRYRRDEVADAAEDLLRLAARAEWDGKPPPHVENWLAERGVEV